VRSNFRLLESIRVGRDSVVRIVSGEFGGRRLVNPPRRGVRPTAERVRAAFFDALGARVEEGAFLDLCAGTGAMALEALSRGAPQVTLVEKDRSAYRTILDNVAKLGLEHDARIRVAHRDLGRWLGEEREGPGRSLRFHTVYLDPPYDERRLGQWLEQLSHASFLMEGAWIAVECSGRQVVERPGLIEFRRRVYGDTVISMLTLERG